MRSQQSISVRIIDQFHDLEISGKEDPAITYRIRDNEIQYCFAGPTCSSSYVLSGNNLESVSALRMDQD